MSSSTAFHDWFKVYHAKNYAVIPYTLSTGRPAFEGYPAFTNARPSLEQLSAWDEERPNKGIALLCGPASNAIAFDLDLDTSGVNAEEKAIYDRIAHLIPTSPVEKIGRRGFTRFFRYSDDFKKSESFIVSGANGRSITVFDLLSNGKPCFLPPSPHRVTGVPYTWGANGISLLDIDASDLPALERKAVEEIKRVLQETYSVVSQSSHNSKNDYQRVSPKHSQSLAEAWIEKVGAEVIGITDKGYQMRCIRPERHSDGKDSNPSGILFHDGGYICSGCGYREKAFKIEKRHPYSRGPSKTYRLPESSLKIHAPYRGLVSKADFISLGPPDTLEQHRFEQLKVLTPDLGSNLQALVQAGVSAELIGAVSREESRLNFPTGGKLLHLLDRNEARRIPFVSRNYDLTHSLLPSSLISIIRERNGPLIVCAPAGSGKTTMLYHDLAPLLLALGSGSALILKERVDDALSLEWRLNQISPVLHLLKTHTSDLSKEGLELIQGLLKKASPWIPKAINSVEPKTALSDVKDFARARISFNKSVCQIPEEHRKKDPCRGCQQFSCRANESSRLKVKNARIAVSTHEAYRWSLGEESLLKYEDKPGSSSVRDLVIFDEKPKVFTSVEVWLSQSVNSLEDTRCSLDRLSREIPETVPFISKVKAKLKEKLKEALRSNRVEGVPLNRANFVCKAKGGLLTWEEYREFAELARKAIKDSAAELSQQTYYSLSSEVNNLQVLCEPVLLYKLQRNRSSDRLSIHWGRNHWKDYNLKDAHVVILDATAYLDPEYSLPNALPVAKLDLKLEYPNLTFKCYEAKKNARKPEHAYSIERANKIRSLAENLENKILVICPKPKDDRGDESEPSELSRSKFEAFEDCFRGAQNVFRPNWFGNLKGSNAYLATNCIFFTHTYRTNEMEYLVRAEHLFEGSGWIKNQWIPAFHKNDSSDTLFWNSPLGVKFCNPYLEAFRVQMACSEMIQTIMRTAVRHDSSAKVDVWLPTTDPAIIGGLLDYFRHAKVELAPLHS